MVVGELGLDNNRPGICSLFPELAKLCRTRRLSQTKAIIANLLRGWNSTGIGAGKRWRSQGGEGVVKVY